MIFLFLFPIDLVQLHTQLNFTHYQHFFLSDCISDTFSEKISNSLQNCHTDWYQYRRPHSVSRVKILPIRLIGSHRQTNLRKQLIASKPIPSSSGRIHHHHYRHSLCVVLFLVFAFKSPHLVSVKNFHRKVSQSTCLQRMCAPLF